MTLSQSDINSVTARAGQRFPDHKVDIAYPVCLPIYELRLKATVMVEHDVSTSARFFLQLLGLNVTSPQEIGRLLGLTDDYVRSVAAELLSAELVKQKIDLTLSITEQGEEILRRGGRSIRPGNRHFAIPYDPLVRKVVDITLDRLLDREVVRKNGDYILPTSPKRPRLGALRIDQVRDYQRAYGGSRGRADTEILEISDIKDYKLRYRDDVVLVKLDAPTSNTPIFAAYHARQYLDDVSTALQRLADRGVDLVPDELKTDESSFHMGGTFLSDEERNLLTSVQELDRALVESDRAVYDAEELLGTTQNAAERATLSERIKQIEGEKQKVQSEFAELDAQLQALTGGETRLVKTEDHRPLLFEAVQRASSDLTVVSAWINPRTLDEELCCLMVAAMERGVRVRIAWGLGTTKAAHSRGSGGDRNFLKANEALSALRDRVPDAFRKQLTIKRTETHEKFVICDDIFCAWGSFNWLSYRGEVDDNYRRETSYYSERPSDLELWEQNAKALFGSEW